MFYPYKEWLREKKFRQEFYIEWDAYKYSKWLEAQGFTPAVYEAYNYAEQTTIWTVDLA